MKTKSTFFLLFICIGIFAQDPGKIAFHLKFDGDISNAVDGGVSFSYSPNLNEEQGVAEFDTGKFNNCLRLDATHHLISDSENTDTFNLGDFSMAMYCKLSELSSVRNQTQFMLQQQNGASAGRAFLTITNNDVLEVYYGGKTTLTDAVITDTWYHFAVVFDTTSKEKRIYVDGVLVSTTEYTHAVNEGQWIVGSNKYFKPVNGFRGCIDDVLLTQEALDSKSIEVLSAYGVDSLYGKEPSIIKEQEQNAKVLKIYSANSQLHILSEKHVQKAHVVVYSLSGQVLYQKTTSLQVGENALSANIPQGLYIVQVASSELNQNKILHFK
ncbi:MAG: T9SS type A sorting domain-containing protein [Bacteroidales bacterium]|nr:T9SS type A sorting domain-containing protein [Bacteroidales bacterium]